MNTTIPDVRDDQCCVWCQKTAPLLREGSAPGDLVVRHRLWRPAEFYSGRKCQSVEVYEIGTVLPLGSRIISVDKSSALYPVLPPERREAKHRAQNTKDFRGWRFY